MDYYNYTVKIKLSTKNQALVNPLFKLKGMGNAAYNNDSNKRASLFIFLIADRLFPPAIFPSFRGFLI
jgi:hypothetical protein